jgi:hypothetical protein
MRRRIGLTGVEQRKSGNKSTRSISLELRSIKVPLRLVEKPMASFVNWQISLKEGCR